MLRTPSDKKKAGSPDSRSFRPFWMPLDGGGVYPTILWKPYGATASRVATAKIPANVPIPVRDALQRGTRRVDPRNASSRASSSAQSVASPSRSHGEGLGMWPVWGGWSAAAGRSVVVIQSVSERGRDKGAAGMVACWTHMISVLAKHDHRADDDR